MSLEFSEHQHGRDGRAPVSGSDAAAARSVTQKQISTGYRVADSTDDGAAYAIAQSIRSTVGALTSANQQLGNVQGLLSTTQSGLNNVSNMMASMRDVLVKLADSSVSGSDRIELCKPSISSMLTNVKTVHPGRQLQRQDTDRRHMHRQQRHGFGTCQGRARRKWRDLRDRFAQAVSGAVQLDQPSPARQVCRRQHAWRRFTAPACSSTSRTSVGTNSTRSAASINYVNNQTTYNSDKIDALNSGLGSLIDADLAQESAQLTALQIRQQLGTQALSLANQAPQTLLSLFK